MAGFVAKRIDECSRSKGAFTRHDGLFQLVQMGSGRKNAPVPFQRAVDVLQSSRTWQSALGYFNVIAVSLENANNRMAHLRQVLTLVREAEVIIKLKKGSFSTKKINYQKLAIELA